MKNSIENQYWYYSPFDRCWDGHYAALSDLLDAQSSVSVAVGEPHRPEVGVAVGEEVGVAVGEEVGVAVGEEVVLQMNCQGWESLQEDFNTCVMGMQYMTAAV
jgi:hypothetical protein